MKIIILITMIFVTLSATSGASEKLYTIPLLKECEDTASTFLKKRRVKYEIKKFDVHLKSHPNLVGYITLKTINNRKEILKYMANTILIDCYPLSEYSISESQSKHVREIVKGYNDTGMGPSYITIQDKKLTVHSKAIVLNEKGERVKLRSE